ncbi:hydroxymethylglutaryl-CoA reductase, degradative [Gilvibacter sediminis]|uniref:hydroxymethylglutaryl-CoA reductase, degradative n=1 Tax=Gilvibacter sediminis TaxID=379071 RepID=UPI002350A2A1|nr:hydroxymethylglutaryl-CoA reductase, degradative [Gilvibacter sediminis]MDC7997390.1 hydroxymethylglutaryl-CoA reductase, degradative [Gilvibacter sediminis]
MSTPISGFSKLSKSQKISWLAENYFNDPQAGIAVLEQYWNSDTKLQQLHDEFIENTLTNYYLPLGIAPNFSINDKLYAIPMAIEESSVVAAASNAAKFWLDKGGFKASIISTLKNGQVHLNFYGDAKRLQQFFEQVKPTLLKDCEQITANMRKRGGGIISLELRDKTAELDGYYQLHATFETLDAMGANFINSCLEQFATSLLREASNSDLILEQDRLEVVMSILSNYVPECIVKAEVSCPLDQLAQAGMSGQEFATKFVRAVQIAQTEVRRAVTHNKGIMNGIDAVVLATGNDFRAVEAGVHAYASKNGHYGSLTHAKIEDDNFHFWIEIPLAIGTVGGLTKLHPLVRLCFEMLGNPGAKELMQIMAVAGLAQNFAALRSLTTTGIQKGHMKMHLMNILNQLEATPQEKEAAVEHFKANTVSHAAAVAFLESLRP